MTHVVRPGDGVLETFRLLATGEHTRGAYFALELGSPPGHETSGHSHDHEEEAEYVATGARQIKVDGAVIEAPAGSFVLVPRGSLHDMWTAGSEPSRYIHLFSPAGIERWFFERARMRGAGASQDELRAAAARHGIRAERTSPPDAAPRIALPRDGEMLVVHGDETNAAYALLALTLGPGTAVPSHVHQRRRGVLCRRGRARIRSRWRDVCRTSGDVPPRAAGHQPLIQSPRRWRGSPRSDHLASATRPVSRRCFPRAPSTVNAPVRLPDLGMIVRATATATDGGLSMMESVGQAPDEGPPLHIHTREDEACYVIEGSYTWQRGDEHVDAVLAPSSGCPAGSRTGS